MKFQFIWVGRTRDKNWRSLEEHYLGRLSHFVRTEIDVVKDASGQTAITAEGKSILAKLDRKPYVCLLDVKGTGTTSEELAASIEGWQNRGVREVAFIIGGASGVSEEVAARADRVLSLSFLTFTHEMARVVLLEQLYRAYTIINNFPYQK